LFLWEINRRNFWPLKKKTFLFCEWNEREAQEILLAIERNPIYLFKRLFEKEQLIVWKHKLEKKSVDRSQCQLFNALRFSKCQKSEVVHNIVNKTLFFVFRSKVTSKVVSLIFLIVFVYWENTLAWLKNGPEVVGDEGMTLGWLWVRLGVRLG